MENFSFFASNGRNETTIDINSAKHILVLVHYILKYAKAFYVLEKYFSKIGLGNFAIIAKMRLI